jgi:hypothetical protein
VCARIGDAGAAVGTGSVPYDAARRVAILSPYDYQQWANDATNSTWQGFFWTSSGAALFNFVTSVRLEYHLFFNEVCHLLVVQRLATLRVEGRLPLIMLHPLIARHLCLSLNNAFFIMVLKPQKKTNE